MFVFRFWINCRMYNKDVMTYSGYVERLASFHCLRMINLAVVMRRELHLAEHRRKTLNQPIRYKYCLYQPIRDQYYLMSTNQE